MRGKVDTKEGSASVFVSTLCIGVVIAVTWTVSPRT